MTDCGAASQISNIGDWHKRYAEETLADALLSSVIPDLASE
ncbi:hypothetical protein HNQ96_004847 [Aminobacter lissarensis]|uniref:Uncharacterized protein n=1 Tax=Aminobacter carboxidus TaxID=376165 RepID=A0A8E1WHD6_9HYPH|nr:hypothetical protein [Aminobacter lissarensis]